MLRRLLTPFLKKQLRAYPAAALLGPRQSGKTTLAKSLGRTYFDLEQKPDQLRLDLEWEDLVRKKDLLILDEAQAYPEVFNKLRGAIDAERKRSGRFLLLGSIAPALMKQAGESLAGRIALCQLTPFLLPELKKPLLDSLWAYGGFPEGGIQRPSRFPGWQENYLTLLSQRDLPQWGLAASPQLIFRLFKMLAACHGQIWNASTVASSLGLSYHTVNRYLEYLQHAFLIFLLPPYFENVGKRLIKSPKLYWNDSGLLHSLLGITTTAQLLHQPWIGASWEGFCISQILGVLKASGKSFDPYFFRTSDGHEIDLLVLMNGKKWAFEFKLSASPSPADLEKLKHTGKLVNAHSLWLISQTRSASGSLSLYSTHLADALSKLTA